MTDKPVVVPATAATPIAITLARYGATALGAWLTSRGYLTGDEAEQMVGVVVTLVPIVLGIIATRRNVAKLQTLEENLPASVAVRSDDPRAKGL